MMFRLGVKMGREKSKWATAACLFFALASAATPSQAKELMVSSFQMGMGNVSCAHVT